MPPKSASALLVAAGLALAGCAGAKHGAATSRTPAGVQKPSAPRLCSSLSAGDVTHITGTSPVRERGLARFPGAGRVCGTIYFDSAGSLLVQITEDLGGAAALRELRAGLEAQFSPADVRSVRGFGAGAFLARQRILTFRRGGRIVTLQTGYLANGKLSLTVPELTRLGMVAVRRG